jgi:hypothetical protein
LLNINRPNLEAVALDVSPTMLKAALDHFAYDPNVKVVEYDLTILCHQIWIILMQLFQALLFTT